MTLVFGTFLNPLFDEGDLGFGEDLVELRRRHVVIRIGRKQPLHHFALFRMARRDGWVAGLAALTRGLERIQAQLTFHLVLVGPVAGVTGVGEDWPDVAVELDAFG